MLNKDIQKSFEKNIEEKMYAVLRGERGDIARRYEALVRKYRVVADAMPLKDVRAQEAMKAIAAKDLWESCFADEVHYLELVEVGLDRIFNKNRQRA